MALSRSSGWSLPELENCSFDPFGGLGRWTPLVLAVRLGVDWKRYRIDRPVDRMGVLEAHPSLERTILRVRGLLPVGSALPGPWLTQFNLAPWGSQAFGLPRLAVEVRFDRLRGERWHAGSKTLCRRR